MKLERYLPDLEVWLEGQGAFALLGLILLFMILSPKGYRLMGYVLLLAGYFLS